MTQALQVVAGTLIVGLTLWAIVVNGYPAAVPAVLFAIFLGMLAAAMLKADDESDKTRLAIMLGVVVLFTIVYTYYAPDRFATLSALLASLAGSAIALHGID